MTDVGRATLVLDAIADGRGPLTLTDLTTRTGLPRSTVHRLTQALERELYLVRGPGQRGYVLGPGLLKFGMNAHLRLLAANRSQLASLAREINENVELAIFSGREVVVVDQIASPERMRGVTKLGKSFSLHASAIGLALLAMLPDPRVHALLSGRLERFTDFTLTDRDQLAARLATIRACRLAVDVEEHDVGICAVATATIGPTGAVQAISVVIPTRRFAVKSSAAVRGLARINPNVDVTMALDQYRIGCTPTRAGNPCAIG